MFNVQWKISTTDIPTERWHQLIQNGLHIYAESVTKVTAIRGGIFRHANHTDTSNSIRDAGKLKHGFLRLTG